MDLERHLSRAQRDLAGVDKERDAAWELHALGKVRDEDLQPRLDTLAQKRETLEVRVQGLEERIGAAKAAAAERVEVSKVLVRASQTWQKASVEKQREIARLVALYAGGLCVDESDALIVRRVEDKGRQRKCGSNGR